MHQRHPGSSPLLSWHSEGPLTRLSTNSSSPAQPNSLDRRNVKLLSRRFSFTMRRPDEASARHLCRLRDETYVFDELRGGREEGWRQTRDRSRGRSSACSRASPFNRPRPGPLLFVSGTEAGLHGHVSKAFRHSSRVVDSENHLVQGRFVIQALLRSLATGACQLDSNPTLLIPS